MATTSPSMGLKIWNLLADPYDHTQLADNWAKVDQHDHSEGKGVQIPTGGIADGAISFAKLGYGVAPIRGLVTSTGTITLGSGFSVATTGTGLYTITFTVPLPNTPVVVPSVFNSSGEATYTFASTAEVKISTFNTAGAATNQAFSFIAIPS